MMSQVQFQLKHEHKSFYSNEAERREKKQTVPREKTEICLKFMWDVRMKVMKTNLNVFGASDELRGDGADGADGADSADSQQTQIISPPCFLLQTEAQKQKEKQSVDVVLMCVRRKQKSRT